VGLAAQEAHQEGEFLVAPHMIQFLFYFQLGRFIWFGRDELGRVHELVGQFHHPFVQGGGKEHGLAVGVVGQLAQEVFEVLDEAHVQEAVGLVHHGQFHALGLEDALLEVVNDAAGGADDYFRGGAQEFGLFPVFDAADDQGLPEAGGPGQDKGVFMYLEGQFPGGGDYEGPGRFRLQGLVFKEPLHQGYEEGRRLARAGLGLPGYVQAL